MNSHCVKKITSSAPTRCQIWRLMIAGSIGAWLDLLIMLTKLAELIW